MSDLFVSRTIKTLHPKKKNYTILVISCYYRRLGHQELQSKDLVIVVHRQFLKSPYA